MNVFKQNAGLIFILFLSNIQLCLAEQELIVASKKFTESIILGEIVSQLLTRDDKTVVHKQELGGTRILWNALLNDEIDVYPEYTGTLRQEILAEENILDDVALRHYLAQNDIVMTEPLGFNNTYVLGMLATKAEQLKIHTISDLSRHIQLGLGFSNEFMSRGDGWLSLQRHYHLPDLHAIGLDHDLAYRALVSGDIDVIDLYSTDAEIEYYKIQGLDDDKKFFTEYKAVYLYKTSLLELYPGIDQQFALLENSIDEESMAQLNSRVKIHKQDAKAVASGFLHRLLKVKTEYEISTIWSRFLKNTLAHLQLVSISLLLAIIVAIPLGVLTARREKLGKWLLAASSIVQTIPALALFVFLIPLLGIGTLPAIVALFLYSLLPILRNTVSGLLSIPPALLESAAAMGLSDQARLRYVELPLALSAIMAGIKTAAVINVGLATLGALIGAGGYGQPILTGIRLDDTGLLLEGAIPAAVLALLVQCLFERIEYRLSPKY